MIANAICCQEVLSWGQRMQSSRLKRREFITLLGGAVAWPMVARAQPGESMRRIGALIASAADDSVFQARVAAFQQGLAQLGWTDGRNVRLDIRWATTNADDLRRHATELAALAPDVLVAATGTATTAPLLQATRTVPIVSSSTRSAPVSSRASPGRAATRPGLRCSNTA